MPSSRLLLWVKATHDTESFQVKGLNLQYPTATVLLIHMNYNQILICLPIQKMQMVAVD